jgi:glycosyltransferase involved in cell wall biosynthesis
VLYLYSNFPSSHRITIVTNKDSNAVETNNIKLSKVYSPGVAAFWSCLREILAHQKPDILHLQIEYSFLGSWLNFLLLPVFIIILKVVCGGSKIVATLHGVPKYFSIYYYLRKHSRLSAASKLLAFTFAVPSYSSIFLTCLLCDAVIVHTELMRSALASFIPSSMLSRVYVIPHGSYEPKHCAGKPASTKDFITVLTIGYQRPSKGLETLLRAAEEISHLTSNVNFIIVGTPIRKPLERKKEMSSEELKAVEIVDSFLEDESLDEVIERADIIVLPYEDMFYEASGVLHRVALFGKALVCSDIPRFRSSLVNRVNALLFRPGDYMELAAHLLGLINDRSLKERLSKKLVESFLPTRWKLVAKEHEHLFLTLLGRRQRAKTVSSL